MDNLSPTKQAILALKQMQKKLSTLENAKHEPIAVIGMGVRFPQAQNPEAFWQLLQQKQDAIESIDLKYWTDKLHSQPHLQSILKQEKSIAYGGFVPHLQEFDAQFFQIAPKEAISIDPQHRLLLEVSWEALENAAIAPERLKGTKTGVFVGICGVDYWHQLLSLKNKKEIDAYLTTGNTHSMASGRLSYFYGLTGPSLSVDTACSSSLVAVHLAINSLRNQECEMALVGGVNRVISPQISLNFASAGMLSSDGRCKTFDSKANGFVRSEGCGVVVLKRLQSALDGGDRILAVLCGSAVNQDGRTSGITVPNSLSQQEVITQALANSRLSASEISYIETHGTGTSVGDVIEIEALKAVFTADESRKNPLILGAVKTNIGHLEGTSGIASLIKVILSLQNEQITANLHFNNPNPLVNWQELPFIVPTTPQLWAKSEQRRIAGVSAFGFSGTNAHVIVSESPPQLPKSINHQTIKLSSSSIATIFTLSARSQKALQELVSKYVKYIEVHPELSSQDICFTSNIGRNHFNHRLAIIVNSTSELQQSLIKWSTNQSQGNIWQGKVQTRNIPKVIWRISDLNGAKILNQPQLLAIEPKFTKNWETGTQVLNQLLKKVFSLQELNQSYLNEIINKIASIYSLAQLYISWGIKPDLLLQSEGIGTFLAGCLAGIFDLETTFNLILIHLANLTPVEKLSFASQFNYSTPKIPLFLPFSSSSSNQELIKANFWTNPTLNDKNRSIQTQDNHDQTIEFELCKLDNQTKITEYLALFYVIGINIRWLGVHSYYPCQKISLPTYPFQRQKYWLE